MPYELARDAVVTIRIYDVKGHLVRELNPGKQEAGSYITKDKAAYWDGRDGLDEGVSSGMYFYNLQVREAIPKIGMRKTTPRNSAGMFRSTRKMLILK